MLWKYLLFETKLLLYNRKNWFLGLILLMFSPIYFLYYSQTQPESLRDQKKYEASINDSIFNQFPKTQRDTPEGEEVYQNIVQQASLVNFQVFYLWKGDRSEEYIESGLLLNQLRLKMHELDNRGIPDYLVKPKEEILKEDALLRYLQEHQLPLQPDIFVASHYLVAVLNAMSGLLFYFFVILSGSEMVVKEQQHRTVTNGFPLSFMKKINSKVSIQFLQVFTFLVLGLLLGGIFAFRTSGLGDFSYPVLIYSNGGFEAISTIHYLLYVCLAMALITVMILYLSILLNMMFKSAYANVLIGLGLFLLPNLLMMMGVKSTLLHSIKFVEFTNVLSGSLAHQLGNSQLDYWYAVIWLVILSLLMMSIIYTKTKFAFIRTIKG